MNELHAEFCRHSRKFGRLRLSVNLTIGSVIDDALESMLGNGFEIIFCYLRRHEKSR